MLPNIEDVTPSKDDKKAFADALAKAVEPVTKEVERMVETVVDYFPDTKREDYKRYSMEYAVERLAEVIKGLAADKGPTTATDAVSAMTGFAGLSEKEKDTVLGQILANDRMQTEILKNMSKSFEKDMGDNLEKLIDLNIAAAKGDKAARDFIEKIERERDRKNAQKTDSAKYQHKTGTLGRAARAMDPKGILGEITAFLNDLGLIVGAFGAVSMIPKQVRESIDEYVAAFVEVRALLKTSFLKPVLEILEKLPIVGTIAKKLPYLSAILAAFDVLPKLFDKFKTGDWWGALETGLKELNRFFLTDVLDLVGQLANYIEKKLFDTDAIDFETIGKSWSIMFDHYVDSLIKGWKGVLAGDFGQTGKAIGEAVVNFANDAVNAVRALFKMPRDFDIAKESLKLKDYVVSKFYELKTEFTTAFYGLVNYTVTSVKAAAATVVSMVSKKFTELADSAVKRVNEAKEWVVDVAASVPGMIGDVWTAVKDKIVDTLVEALDSLVGLKDDMADWFVGIVDAIKAKILSYIPFMEDEKPVAEVSQSSRSMRKTESNIIRSTMAAEDAKSWKSASPTSRAPVVSNKSSTQINNLAVTGKHRVGTRNPLSVSSGGGGGGGGY